MKAVFHDVAIVGAGMAGASLAAEIGDAARVLLLEAEEHPGYHATGRSAAFWLESYGGPGVAPLTAASRVFLDRPPADFSARGFLRARGALHLAGRNGGGALARLRAAFAGSGVRLDPVDRAGVATMLPGVRPGWEEALFEPSCADIDVAALHAAYLAAARRAGAALRCKAPLLAARFSDGRWTIETGAGRVTAALLVNAAGAWADEVAARSGVRPLGIRPYRRTMAQVRVHPAASPDLPLVIDAEERFYLKPEAGGRLWITPHDETPSPPGDVAAEEIDVARAIASIEELAAWRVTAVERRWAGLRSFAPDRLPVYGFAADMAGFFWFAGQGGFGIQTAPAAARLGAALLLGRVPPEPGIDPARYSPVRFGPGAGASGRITGAPPASPSQASIP